MVPNPTMNNPRDNYETALDAAEKGYACIPCSPGTKVPTVKWKTHQTTHPTQKEYREWFQNTGNNIAIITTGLVVFDVDDAEKAEIVLRHCGDTPHKLWTPRGGIHLGYRKRKGVVVTNQVRIKGMPIDIRTDGGLEMIPPSRTEMGVYEWLGSGLLPLSELPVARVGWTRERRPMRVVTPVIPAANAENAVWRARGYLAHIEGAIAGMRGHDRTFRVACVLVIKFGLSLEEAWPLFLEWNEQCEPPWSEKELLHKLQDASKLRCL